MYQQTIVIGNVGQDATLRYTQTGKAVCSFNVATSENWKDASGEKHEKTLWFRVSVWGKMAETANQYVKKGMKIMIQGRVSVSAYMGKDGQPAASLELTADEMKFLSRVDGNGSDAPADNGEDALDIPF